MQRYNQVVQSQLYKGQEDGVDHLDFDSVPIVFDNFISLIDTCIEQPETVIRNLQKFYNFIDKNLSGDEPKVNIFEPKANLPGQFQIFF